MKLYREIMAFEVSNPSSNTLLAIYSAGALARYGFIPHFACRSTMAKIFRDIIASPAVERAGVQVSEAGERLYAIGTTGP